MEGSNLRKDAKLRRSLFPNVPPFVQFEDSSHLVSEQIESSQPESECGEAWPVLLLVLTRLWSRLATEWQGWELIELNGIYCLLLISTYTFVTTEATHGQKA